MQGLLTALLGGAAGASQGIAIQNERDLKRQQLAMEQAKMKADLFMQGFDPSDAAAAGAPAGPQMPAPNVAPPQVQQTPQPPGPAAAPYVPSQYGAGSPRRAMPAAPGGVSAIDIMRDTVPAPKPAPQAQPSSDPEPFSLSRFMQSDGQTVNLPGVGNYHYNFARSPMARTYILDALKKKMETDELIRRDQETGVTAKNKHDAEKLQLGDTGFSAAMGDVAGAEAAARLPIELRKAVMEGRISLGNALQQISARGQIEAGLQGTQQNFTAGENAKNRTHATELQQSGQAGSFLNASELEHQKSQGTLSGKVLAPPAAKAAPSAALAGATPAQRLWDAAVAMHGQEKVLKEYGPRP